MVGSKDVISDYCERLDSSFWAEPINAITNLAFILVALLLIRELVSARISPLKAFDIVLLIGVLFAIGIGSFLWHTLATSWAEWADIIPILLFISLYLLSFLFRIAGLKTIQVLIWFVLYHLFNSSMQTFIQTDTLNGSIFYLPTWATLILIGIYTRHRHHPSANRILMAGILFTFSILFRTFDSALCPLWPTGTHFFWHIITAYVLYTLTMALITTMQSVRSCPD